MTPKNLTRVLLAAAGLAVALTGCKPDYPKCKEDSHCSEKGEVCVEGVCKECSKDADCKEGFQCKQNACVPLPQCRADGDCKDGLRCRAEKCVPECTSDRECARGEKCSEQSRCVSAAECSTDVDCGEGRICSADQRCIAAPKVEAPPVVDDEEARKRAALASCALESILFDFNDFDLSTGARAVLDKNAECIRFKKLSVTIEGHADERGTEEYNIVLGEKRANMVKRYLVGLQVDENALKTVSYGEEKPVDSGNTEEAWTKNRRAEFKAR